MIESGDHSNSGNVFLSAVFLHCCFISDFVCYFRNFAGSSYENSFSEPVLISDAFLRRARSKIGGPTI